MSQLKMWRPASAVACAVLFACAGIAYGGPDWVEGGDDDGNFLPDAGPLPESSQPIDLGEGTPIVSIRGRLAGSTEGGGTTGDLEDMYLVVIDDFDSFFLSTEQQDTFAAEGPGSFVCTSLYLFTGPDHPAGEGLGIVGNVDSPFGCGAWIDGFPTDGSSTPALIDGLAYYVCVAGDGRFPVDGQGQQIFSFFDIEGKYDDEVSGPDGPGGNNPIAGWQGFGDSGDYTVPQIFAVSGVSPANALCDVKFEPEEFNDLCVGPFGDQTLAITADCTLINGKLEKREVPGPQPDTWLCVFDKFGNLIASDDNDSETGNGKGSGLWSGDGDGDGWADILTANGDGTYSLRLGVTGFPDGFDGDCNGFFQNAPHGQIGEFCIEIVYEDAGGGEIRTDTYVDEFVSGAEAFRLNFTAPAGSAEVHINIDNTCGMEEICMDVDYMCFSNLEPLGAYCITVVGGLDYDCNPTDTQLCWIDKNCDVIGTDDESGPAPGYSQLCVIADVNGNICIAVSGGGDDDCDGYIGDIENGASGLVPHGVCGTYVLQLERNPDANQPSEPDSPHPDDDVCPESAMATFGDVNMDGVVDAADLAKLLSNWGMVTATP